MSQRVKIENCGSKVCLPVPPGGTEGGFFPKMESDGVEGGFPHYVRRVARAKLALPHLLHPERLVRFLERDLTAQLVNANLSDLAHVRAKIGLELLERDFAQTTDSGWRVRFKDSNSKHYQREIQPVFVAFVSNTELAATNTSWRLRTVRWHDTGAPPLASWT